MIDETYESSLHDWLGTFRAGSLLILDEAHHAAPSSGQRYAIDSHITRAVRDLAPKFEHRLFLSATPHNGHSNSFSALLEILDPQRFCRGVKVSKKMLDDVMVRRLKDDLRKISGGFPERKVVQENIDGLPKDAPELRLTALLDEYRITRELRLSGDSRRTQSASGLLICGLQQRLFSSIEAFARTLRVHRRTVQKQRDASLAKEETAAIRADLLAGMVSSDDDRAVVSEQELAGEEEAQFAAVSAASIGKTTGTSESELFAHEQKLLDEMTELAESCSALPDARVSKLIDWIKVEMCPNLGAPDAKWNNLRVLIFTEYEDTQALSAAAAQCCTQRFRSCGRTNCDLSWSYASRRTRSDQDSIQHRPGTASRPNSYRDRCGPRGSQPAGLTAGTSFTLTCRGIQAGWSSATVELIENFNRIPSSTATISSTSNVPKIGCWLRWFGRQRRSVKNSAVCQQVIDSKLEGLMKGGIRRSDVGDLENKIDTADLEQDQRETVEEELEASRERELELRAQIERLSTMLERSQQAIAFSESHFRSALSCALEVMGADPLKPAPNGKPPARSVFPALDQRAGADPSWAETMDSLRVPRPRDQKFWEWRRTSPIRPVVFEDPGIVTEEVVQMHLEQRVVQRLLSRFMAQGFVHHDLSRACMAQTTDAVPRVLLIGRLALYGPGAARLHEELIPVTARWVDPAVRKGELAPYSREAETKTMALLDTALLEKHAKPISDVVLRQLQECAPRDVRELLPHLEARGDEYAKDAITKLEKRAEAESKAMREILESQKKHLSETVVKHEKIEQLHLFDEQELRQLDSNRRYWAKRLSELDGEMKTEPDRIRSLYEVRAQRVEPVGLVYLWPITR